MSQSENQGVSLEGELSRLTGAQVQVVNEAGLADQDMLTDLQPWQIARLTRASSLSEFFQVLWELRAPATPRDVEARPRLAEE